MASDLDIVNGGLSRIGIPPISAIGEDSEPGALAATTYYTYRDQLLESHPWTFATKTVELSPASSVPAGWGSAWLLPADCLRVLILVTGNRRGTAAKWEIQNDDSRKILVYEVEDSALNVKYIKRVEQSGLYSSGFVDSLMAKLATEWAEPLTSSNTLMDRMDKRFKDKTRESRSAEGQQASPKVVRHHSWSEAR